MCSCSLNWICGYLRGRTHTILRKERDLLRLVLAFSKDSDAHLPGRLLAVVDFAEIKQAPLHDAAAVHPVAFHDGPDAMFLAVFAPGAALQVHDSSTL